MTVVPLEWISRRRARFTASRTARGLERPKPLGVLVVNAMSASTGSRHARDIMLKAAWTPGVDLLIGSECFDFDAQNVLGDAWQVFQPGTLGSPESSCLIAIRKGRGKLASTTATVASPADKRLDVRERSVLSAVAFIGTNHSDPGRYVLTVKAGHAPPMRAWTLWPAYMTAMHGVDLAGADYNHLARFVGPVLRRRMRMVGVVGAAVRWWIPSTKPRAVDVGGDHMAVFLTLWPSKKENR